MALARITVLISGRGSNIARIDRPRQTRRTRRRRHAGDQQPPGGAGTRARRAHGIATTVVDHRAYRVARRVRSSARGGHRSQRARPRRARRLHAHPRAPLSCSVTRGRMLNIHPSLLPAYPGVDTHRRALADGATRHGCTVHFVTPDVDGGPIVAQAEVPRAAGDDDPARSPRACSMPSTAAAARSSAGSAPAASRWKTAACASNVMATEMRAGALRLIRFDDPRTHRRRPSRMRRRRHAGRAGAAQVAPARRARRCRCSLHAMWSLWPVEPSTTPPEETVLTATLTEMPPPPVVTTQAAPPPPPAATPKPQPKRRRASRASPPESWRRKPARRRRLRRPMRAPRRPVRQLPRAPARRPRRSEPTARRPMRSPRLRSCCRRVSTSPTACSSARTAS